MKKQKSIFLFLALILPILVFLFLKYFGKNEFFVPPLYVEVSPVVPEGCGGTIVLPYHIPDSVKAALPFEQDSLVVLHLGAVSKESSNQLSRVHQEFPASSIGVVEIPITSRTQFWKQCVYFLGGTNDVVLVDRRGVIRGQYNSTDREDIDRLLTELSIILKQY